MPAGDDGEYTQHRRELAEGVSMAGAGRGTGS
jgi:hypothetical protein